MAAVSGAASRGQGSSCVKFARFVNNLIAEIDALEAAGDQPIRPSELFIRAKARGLAEAMKEVEA